jgi:hypothetical protein
MKKIYLGWFSDQMSDNRKNALTIFKKSCGVEVEIVNDLNFYDFENSEIKIHKAFRYLSDVHKSAYIRPYIMYFYGGGYSDVKANSFDWNIYFEKLFSSDLDAIGYAEKNVDDIAPFWKHDKRIDFNDVKNNYNRFAGNGHYIFKPNTAFAKEWLIRLHEILDAKYKFLIKNSGTYHPYAISGGIHESYNGEIVPKTHYENYPIEWNEINGRIKQKIEYKNNFSNFLLEMPYPNMENYR